MAEKVEIISPIEMRLEIIAERKKYFENVDHYLQIIKREVTEIFPDAKVYLFGSVIRGDYKIYSDVDVMIVSDRAPENISEQSKIKVHLLREIGDLFAPFEFHITTTEVFENWYKKFIKDEIKME